MPDFLVLGFDFGLRHIGVAVGQSVTGTARPLPSLVARAGVPNWHQIEQLCAEWQPQILMVGMPLSEAGSEHGITKLAKHFANQLRDKLQLPVHLVDERYTTLEAKRDLSQLGKRRVQKTQIDGWAAKIITEAGLRELSQ
ncbi:MAG: Holliday junction resolvase RuvX [Gammaproteobacteria bacterium]